MSVDPQILGLLSAMADRPALDPAAITPTILREAMDQPIPVETPPHVASITDLTLMLDGRSLAARLYMPDTGDASPPPLTIFFHGGGWVIGTIETHDSTCRALALASGSAVLSVAYRLAPEHPFPAPLDDCSDAVRYAAAHGASWGVDSSRLAVAGDSAGANLAAAAAMRLRDEDGPALRHQLLFYPVADRDFSRSTYVEYGNGEYFLSTQIMQYFWHCYLPADQDDGGLARLVHAPNLSALPSTTLIAAQYDPLSDEGMAFADLLEKAGNKVAAFNAPGMIHGFISMFPYVTEAQNWIDRAGARLREALA